MAEELLLRYILWFPLTDLLDFVAFAKRFVLKLYFKLKFPFERQHKEVVSQRAGT